MAVQEQKAGYDPIKRNRYNTENGAVTRLVP